MDTKSKKFNDRFAVRACAFILCVLMFVSGTVALLISVQHSYDSDPFNRLSTKYYKDSSKFKNDLTDAVYASGTLYHYGSEESIKKGESVDPNIEKNKVRNYYNEYIAGNLYTRFESDEDSPEKKDLPYYNYVDEYEGAYYEPKPYDSSVSEQVLKDYGEKVDEYAVRERTGQIENQLAEFAEAENALANFAYYVSDGKKTVTNIAEAGGTTDVDSLTGNNKAVLVSRGYDTYYGVSGEYQNDTRFINGESVINVFSQMYDTDSIEPGSLSLFIGIDDNYYDLLAQNYSESRTVLMISVTVMIIAYLLSLILLIYLISVSGRKDDKGNVMLYYTDRLYSEIQLVILLIACISAVFISPIFGMFNYQFDNNPDTIIQNIGTYLIWALALAALSSVALWFFLAMVRMLKAHIFFRRFLIVIAVGILYRWISTAFSRANPMGKFILIIVAACIASMTVVLGPVAIVLLLGFGYGWIRKYTALKKGVDEVTNGNLDYKIPVDVRSNTEFDQMAVKINTISQASNKAIQNELKNQRLKTDLISNVSHDLKTPLTSIITYTDLLKKEGLDSPNAGDYLSVIDDKSQRLKTLTEDLFEAAKASSGSIPVRIEKVDILALINQGIAEFEEKLNETGLDVIINAPKENYYVSADSQLLWRVVENLLNNVSKYALENSRVYIDLAERELNSGTEPIILFEMKNMSKASLNIPEEVLMERFKRGDESRTTEGSGLGLAIAKDLIRLQNGWFEIKIDGDLFKSTVMLESYNEEKAKAANATAAEQAEAEEKMYPKQDDGMPKIQNF